MKAIREPKNIWGLVREHVGDDPREHMLAILLDARHRVVSVETVSIGTATGSLVHPREVFRPAIIATPRPCCALILAHNHPSGDPNPSPEDREVTQRLRNAGTLLGIPVLDHVICARETWVSMRERESWTD